MTDLNNTHDLIIGGDGNDNNVMNGFLDDLRINTLKDRYENSFVPPTLSHDRGLGDESIRRPIMVNNQLYSPTEEISMTDIEISNTVFGERSSGNISFVGRYSDGSSFNLTPYRTITQLSGFQYGSINGAGSVSTGNIRYTTGVMTGKIHVRHKGILEKEFTVIVNDTIQKDLNLIDALSVAGLGHVVCIDAGDANSGLDTEAINLSGGNDFDYASGVSRVGALGQLDAYFSISDGIGGLEPINGTTRSWSDSLHSGNSYSFCAVVSSSDFALCGTWSNSTSDRGMRIRIDSDEIRVQNYGRATSPTSETNLTIFTEPPAISGWTFIAGSITPGGDIFFRRNKEYIKIEGYRRSTTTTNLSTPVEVLSGITSSSPSGSAPLGQFHVGSTPGNTPEGGANIACFAFVLGGVSFEQFDSVYDSIKERYGLPE